MTASAYLFVVHGSRAAIYQQALAAFMDQLRHHLTWTWALDSRSEASPQHPTPASYLVELALLECTSQPLSGRILQIAEQARMQSIPSVQIVPLFLLPGVHVMQDIPTAVQQAQQQLSSPTIEVAPYLGAAAMLPQWLQQRVAQVSAEARLVVAHGSRRSQGNQPVEALAQRLDATVAYWAIQPSFADQVERLYGQGYRQIAVLPYILFPGGMSQGLIEQSVQLTQHLPQLQLTILPCLAEEEGLVKVLLNQIGLLDRPRSTTVAGA